MSEYEFDYQPGKIVGGVDCVSRIGAELTAKGLERALVMCGSTVGSTSEVMDPLQEGLGDSLAGVFDETSAKKRLRTALAAAERARELDADVLVAAGGGSTLDTAKATAALSSYDDIRSAAERMVEAGDVPVADDGEPLPIAAVPTTLAGADLSVIAGSKLTLDREDPRPENEIPNGSVSDSRLMPTVLCYDAALFAATPTGLLTASAMNGFDKAVEALYSPYATPVTDGTATEGARLLYENAAALAAEDPDLDALSDAVDGIVLAQYGISTPGRYKASIIHAFSHGFSHDYDVHQGTIHAVVAPHVLRFVFEQVDGSRAALARAFGAPVGELDDDGLAAAAVAGVESVRDDLGLPARLRDVDGLEESALPGVAAAIVDDGLMAARPEGVSVDPEAVEDVLRAAW